MTLNPAGLRPNVLPSSQDLRQTLSRQGPRRWPNREPFRLHGLLKKTGGSLGVRQRVSVFFTAS